MSALSFVLATLAVWRLTHLIHAEDGPFDVVMRLRNLARAGSFGKLLECFYCLSLWVAAPFAVLLQPAWRQRIVLWLALSGAAILVQRFADAFAPDRPPYVEGPFPEIPAHHQEEQS